MLVYVCCAGGATSGMLCTKIRKAGEKDYKIYVDDIETVLRKEKHGELEAFDIRLAYGPVGLLSDRFVKEYAIDKYVDLVYIAPQVRFQVKEAEKLLGKYQIKCSPIDMKIFGRMNGEKMLEEILSYR